jgi:hypothetical protein|tara:strand:+ start:80 stop:346 length:267 start_codon:yes stop_codon:yes gene_type:complete
MIQDKEVYVIRGKELKDLISLLSDLKFVALEYAKTNQTEIDETEKVYDDMVDSMLQSKLFKTFKLEDLRSEFSFNELLRNAGLKLGRN